MTQNYSFVHPNAKIGNNVTIDPFVFIDDNVEIGDGTHLFSHATVLNGSRIGKNCRIFPGAVVGGIPQDLKFRGEVTTAVVGDNTTIRECATVNRGTASKGTTIVGSNCLIMAYSHIAHDCVVGNNIIIGNASQIAGEVVIDDYAIISACVLIHQFCHVGGYVMVGGGTRTSQDIPPFVTAAREPVAMCGLNLVGLRRRGFTSAQIRTIQDVYHIIYDKSIIMADRLKLVESSFPDDPHAKYVTDFVQASISPKGRGIIY